MSKYLSFLLLAAFALSAQAGHIYRETRTVREGKETRFLLKKIRGCSGLKATVKSSDGQGGFNCTLVVDTEDDFLTFRDRAGSGQENYCYLSYEGGSKIEAANLLVGGYYSTVTEIEVELEYEDCE